MKQSTQRLDDEGDSELEHEEQRLSLSQRNLQNVASKKEYMKSMLKVYSSPFVTIKFNTIKTHPVGFPV